MITKANSEGNLEVHNPTVSRLLINLLAVLGGLFFASMGLMSLYNSGMKSLSGVLNIIIGSIGIVVGLPRERSKNSYLFFKKTNRVDYWLEGEFFPETKYFHTEITRSPDNQLIPTWNIIIFILGGKSPIIRITDIPSHATAIRIHSYCRNVLKSTTSYKLPQKSIEEICREGKDFNQAVSEITDFILKS